MKKISYCVSGNGFGFRAVVQACQSGLIDGKILKVVCDRPSPVLAWAQDHGVATELVDFKTFKKRQDFDKAVEDAVSEGEPDWVFLTYNRLLPQSTIDLFGGRILNQHMALLPLFPGLNSITESYHSGMKIGGVTIHLVTAGMDEGQIIAQAVVPIDHSKGADHLGLDLFKVSIPLQLQAIRWMAANKLMLPSGDQQDPVIGSCYNSGPFFPVIDADIMMFSKLWLSKMQLLHQ